MDQSSSANSPALRRAARRQATYDELIALARRFLREGRALSLRGIATEMGLTAPALYRYVDSHAALQKALVEAIYDDVLGELNAAADAWPTECPRQRLLASIVAFRSWALTAPEEFRLVFGQPKQGWDSAEDESLPRAIRFFVHFMVCLARLHEMGEVAMSAPDSLPEHATREVGRFLDAWGTQEDVPPAPPALWWDGLRDWIVVCGVLRMEVDGLVPSRAVRDASLFRDTLCCIGMRAGGKEEQVRRSVDVAFGLA